MGSGEEYVATATASEQFGASEFDLRRPLSQEEYRRYREEYGYLRAYFKAHPRRFASTQQWLNQSHAATTYEKYLARSVQYALVVALFGALLGIVVSFQLSQMGSLAGLQNPLPVGFGIASFVGSHRLIFAGGAITLLGGGLFGGMTWTVRYYAPYVRTTMRRQEINVFMPHAVVFLYALSHGGTSLFESFKALADAEETYGEIANEFEMVVNDVELFGTDMHTAIRNARNTTPSKSLERFFDDLIGVLESGGDVTVILEEQSDTYLREAREEQQNFLETIALLAEVFVVLFVAAPLFLIVTLVVIDMAGGSSLGTVTLLVYVVMPLAMVGFIVLIDLLGKPFELPRHTAELPTGESTVEFTELEGSERYDEYRWNRRKEALRDVIQNPVSVLQMNPLYTMLLTVPLATALVAFLLATGRVTPSIDAMTAAPVWSTTALFLAPFLVVAAPLAFFHDTKRRREQVIAHEFPKTLNVLASANKMGIAFTDALELISAWSGDAIGEELRRVRNDIVWNYDVRRALLAFGNRVSVPQLGRTMKLLSDGIYTSGDLTKVLSIAADDIRDRDEMERARRRELSTYIAVVVMGFLVYLMAIVMLDVGYLQAIAEFGDQETLDTGTILTGFQDVPIETYQTIFLHSALIQAIGTGLLAGKLADNDAISGLKYGIGLVLVTMAVFLLI